MQTIEFSSLADEVATLPAEGAARDRQLFRLIDLRAARAAAGALHASATGANDPVLTAVDEIIGTANDAARDRLRDAIASPKFAPVLRGWMRELREIASAWPDSGACTIATALKLWAWTLDHFRSSNDAAKAIDDLAESLGPLVAARCLIADVVQDASELRLDLAHVYAAQAAALAGATCAELVYGYRHHLVWDAAGCGSCYASDDLDELEAFMPGIASGARTSIDIIESDGSHPAKRGPCARFDGVDAFVKLRNRLDACLSGSRIAKDRAAAAVAGRK